MQVVSEPKKPERRFDRGEARRQAFLDAARQVFLAQGFEAANVSDVVRVAGGSMATLYAQFGNKEGLFLAVARDQQERFVRAVMPASMDDLPLEQGLQRIGEGFLRAILDCENLAFFRIIVGEGRQFPELLQRYLASVAERVRSLLESYLRVVAPHCPEIDRASGYFFEMLRSRHHYRALADEGYVLSDAEITAHVASVVRFFMAAIHAATVK
jgi:AcrR family transcriptional regulator